MHLAALSGRLVWATDSELRPILVDEVKGRRKRERKLGIMVAVVARRAATKKERRVRVRKYRMGIGYGKPIV